MSGHREMIKISILLKQIIRMIFLNCFYNICEKQKNTKKKQADKFTALKFPLFHIFTIYISYQKFYFNEKNNKIHFL